MLRVLGIDPGFDRTGIGVIESDAGRLRWIFHGCVQTRATQALSERLQLVRDGVVRAVREHAPQLVCIEKLFFQTNAKTAMQVGMARGVILLAIADAGVPYVEVTPGQVKQGVAGWGQADKKQIQKMVRLLLKLPALPTPDDAADALAIAIVGSSLRPTTPSDHG